MKIRSLLTVGLMLAGITSPSFAFQRSEAPRSDRLIERIVCDPNGDGKQANCMRDCDDEEVRSRATYAKQTDEERLAKKKACDTKCGC
jgi:hypothetical protein